MEVNVENVLITPCQLALVKLINHGDFFLKLDFPHSREIHEHHTGVDAKLTVEGMASEACIPAGQLRLTFRCHRCDLIGCEGAKNI